MANQGMTMQGLAAMAIGVLTLIVVFIVIPLVGSQMDQAVVLPGCTDTTNVTGCSAGYAWNSTFTTTLPTAVGLWASLGGILKVAGVIVIVGGFLQTLRGLRG